MAESLPATAVIRVSHVTFDSELFDDVIAADRRSSDYLIPAIGSLPGLLHYFSGYSRDGSFAQVSVWDSEEHASQMDRLTEMTIRARGDFRAVGVDFGPEHASIVNYPITWSM